MKLRDAKLQVNEQSSFTRPGRFPELPETPEITEMTENFTKVKNT